MWKEKKHVNKYSVNVVIKDYVEYSQLAQKMSASMEKKPKTHYVRLKAVFKENIIFQHWFKQEYAFLIIR